VNLPRLCATAAIVALVAGCAGGSQPVANQTDPAPSTAAADATKAPSATDATSAPTPAAPTAGPTTAPTPAAQTEPAVSTSQTLFRSWKNSINMIEYQIVIEVTNTGGGFAKLTSGDQSFTVYAKDDSVLATGDFSYAFPQVIGAGEKGYYVASGYFDKGTTLAGVGRLEPSLSFGTASGPAVAYEVTKVKVTQESYGTGLQVAGVVKNTSAEDASMGLVGVVMFDGAGKMLGALYDNTDMMGLRAGQAKGFKTTYPGTPPLKPTQVKATKAFAFDYSFF
jgi:hypothetical protein